MKSCLELLRKHTFPRVHSMILIILWINPFEVSEILGETTSILYEYKDEKTKTWEANHVCEKPTCF